jgi:hydrogenase expression/formation protein HypD
MLERDESGVENAYARSVKAEGNLPAKALLEEVFTACDRNWRGIGNIPAGGFALRDNYLHYDASLRFGLESRREQGKNPCMAGEILTGKKKPPDCPVFGRECNPEHPLGAPMVSSEGACAAYYRYGLRQLK